MSESLPLERLDDVTLRIPRSARPGMRVDGLVFADERLELEDLRRATTVIARALHDLLA